MSIASNIAAVKNIKERTYQANVQSNCYLDEAPYSETWTFIDKSTLEYDWQTGQWTAQENV